MREDTVVGLDSKRCARSTASAKGRQISVSRPIRAGVLGAEVLRSLHAQGRTSYSRMVRTGVMFCKFADLGPAAGADAKDFG